MDSFYVSITLRNQGKHCSCLKKTLHVHTNTAQLYFKHANANCRLNQGSSEPYFRRERSPLYIRLLLFISC